MRSTRFIGLSLVTFLLFTSCPMGSKPMPRPKGVVITPGEGTPKYTFLADDGSFINTDTGRTVLYIDDNKNAKGVYVVSDIYGSDSRVTFINENNGSKIALLFKPNSNFPYYMEVTNNNQIYRTLFTNYRDDTSSYNIIYLNNNKMDSWTNGIVLN